MDNHYSTLYAVVVSDHRDTISLGFWLPILSFPSWWGTVWDRDMDPVISALALLDAAPASPDAVVHLVDPGGLIDLLDDVREYIDPELGTFSLTSHILIIPLRLSEIRQIA